MADTPELIPPMKPGIDHPQHIEEARQIVAKNAGESVADVTPPDEIAENIVNDARTGFLKNVAGVKQQLSNQTSGPQKADSSDGFKETLDVYNPWGGDDSTTRIVPTEEMSRLRAKRVEEMNPQKEVA